MNLYDDADCESADVELHISGTDNIGVLSNNPKIYRKFANGFQANFGTCLVSWFRKEHSNKLFVRAEFNLFKLNSLLGFVKRLRSMEYPNELERFEQILYELIIVPTVYMLPDTALMHAATLASGGGAVTFTGTGGVGKSSAILSAAHNQEFSFVSDDISVINNKGRMFANFAWPKIYGYNCAGNQFKKLLLKDRSWIDRVHFTTKNARNPSSVRRKIRPEVLFNGRVAKEPLLKMVVLLFREDVDSIKVGELNRQAGLDMFLEVMMAEYQVFHKFINWEKYNSLGNI